MQIVNVRLSASQAADIAVLCTVGPDKLESITQDLTGRPVSILESVVSDAFTRHLNADQASALKRIVFGITSLTQRDRSKVPSAMAAINRSLKVNFKADERFARWEACASALQELLETDTVFFTAKAMNVSYDFERVLIDSRILTSIRPIINDERSKVIGTTIVQTLRLDYLASDGSQSSLSIALDLEDLTDLRNACDDGINKARLAKKEIEQVWERDVVMPGEDA